MPVVTRSTAPAEEIFFYQDPYSAFRKGERGKLVARAEAACLCSSCILDPIDGSCVKCGHPASWSLFLAFRERSLLPLGPSVYDAELDRQERRDLQAEDESAKRENRGHRIDPALKAEAITIATRSSYAEAARQTGLDQSTIWRWLNKEKSDRITLSASSGSACDIRGRLAAYLRYGCGLNSREISDRLGYRRPSDAMAVAKFWQEKSEREAVA